MRNLARYIFALIFATGCTSSKPISSNIDAYDQTILLAHKLKQKPGNQHLWNHLNRAYPEAVAWFESEIEPDNIGSAQKLKWTNTCTLMLRANAMSDSIMAIPEWDKHISGLRTYTTELDSAKKKAVNECIQQAQFLDQYNSAATLHIAMFYLDQAFILDANNVKAEDLRNEISKKIKSLPSKE